MPSPDLRARAFEALLPISLAVRSAIHASQSRVLEYQKANLAAWAGWTSSQRAAAVGSARFNWLVLSLKVELAPFDEVTYFSRPDQELSNLFLWLVRPGLGLRVKHEPAELSAQSSATLFDAAPREADQSACLTWIAGPDGEIFDERLVAGHGGHWSIALADLVAAAETLRTVRIKPQTVKVESARKEQRETLAPGDAPS